VSPPPGFDSTTNRSKFPRSVPTIIVNELTVTVGMVVVGAVFPAAAVGIVVAGLVRIAVEAAMNAAEEQCGKF
jgi:hypothetical protein